MRRHRYTAHAGTAHAIRPDAFGWLFGGMDDAPAAPERVGPVAIVSIHGALSQRGCWWSLGYDQVVARFAAACETDAAVIMLDIDSPGGEVAGCFAAVRSMRAMAARAGKRVVAFANECAASAAYALATVADEVCVPESGNVGSVGVIGMVSDYTEAMAKEGIRVAVLTTGVHKADGNPMTPLSDAALATLQAEVDKLGAQFFGLVAERRPLSADQVQALEAGMFLGQDAVDAGLADEVISREALIARLSGQQETTMSDETEETEATEGEETEAEEGKCAPESESAEDGEDMPEEDDGEEEAPAAAASAHSSRDILAVVRSITGQSSPAAQIGALHALAMEAKRASKLAAKLAKLEGASAKAAHAARVDGAVKAGKLAPSQRAWAMGVSAEVLSGYLAAAPAVAPKPAAPPKPAAQADDNGLTKAEREIAANLGLTAEAYSKHKAAMAAKGTIQ